MPNHSTLTGLTGKRILVTRPAEQAFEFLSGLKNAGAEAVLFPTIAIRPADDWSVCDEALENFDTWNVLVFTSVNGVRFFVEHAQTVFPHLTSALQKLTVYTVGEKTAFKAAACGLSAVHFDNVQNAEHLAEELAQHVKGNVLFPCGSLTGDTLRKKLELAGIAVKPVVVYQTLPARPDNTESVATDMRNGRIDVVTFFSPSSINNFIELIPNALLKQCAVAAIGNTTAQAVRAHGLNPDMVAEKSDSQNVIKTLENYYRG